MFELQDRPDLSVDRVETIYSYLPRTNPQRFSDIVDHYNRWLLYRDDAYHDRLKALFIKAMTPRAVERLASDGPSARRGAARPACRARRLRRLSRFRGPHSDPGHARPARPAGRGRDADAALERSLLEFPVPAGQSRQGGDGAGTARHSRRPAGLFHAAHRGAPQPAGRGHDQRYGAGRRGRRKTHGPGNPRHLQHDGDGGRRHLAQRDRDGAMATAAIPGSTCQAQGESEADRSSPPRNSCATKRRPSAASAPRAKISRSAAAASAPDRSCTS